jgi:hypothetical protein
MITFDDVLGAAQGLPPTDRIRLIHALKAGSSAFDWFFSRRRSA